MITSSPLHLSVCITRYELWYMRHIVFLLSYLEDCRIKNKICITLVLSGALILVDKITIKLQ